MENFNQTHIQAKLFDLALVELVRQHRESFQPLWTVDSWVKFLIWITLNCGLSGEKESLVFFAEALGPKLTARMRRVFFERNVDALTLQVMADPAESKVLVLPISDSALVTFDQAKQALDQVGLLKRVALDEKLWLELDAVIAIPWEAKTVER